MTPASAHPPEVGDCRIEHDSLGEIAVPREAYYGAQTMRAVQNFPIGDRLMPSAFIHALGLLKRAAAEVNLSMGELDQALGQAIVEAAGEVASGRHDDQFPIGVFQTGSGTSSNMNANEVIARRAAEILRAAGKTKADVHPNDHVNKGQSSNDVVPTAIHLAAMLGLRDDLIPALQDLETSLRRKACEFWPVVKTGRTHLQDATPIRLGQEFLGYADQVGLSVARTERTFEFLGQVALGGTAVGTGINAHPDFARLVLERIAQDTRLELAETQHHFMAQSSIDPLVDASGALRTTAVGLTKIANDIRWMSSGPSAGLAELELPELQPGSSIMPGKVNPVVAESLMMVCAQVIGYDAAITIAGQSSNFELNTMLPLVAHDLLDGITILSAAARNFRLRLVEGIKATERGPEMVERGLMLVTALAPRIGYDEAAAIAKEARRRGRTIRDLARERTELSDQELDRLLDPNTMVGPHDG